MKWMYRKCHLKEIPHEQQTPLDQESYFYLLQDLSLETKLLILKWAVFQSSHFANRQLKQ